VLGNYLTTRRSLQTEEGHYKRQCDCFVTGHCAPVRDGLKGVIGDRCTKIVSGASSYNRSITKHFRSFCFDDEAQSVAFFHGGVIASAARGEELKPTMLFVESRTSEKRVAPALRLPLLESLQERGLLPLIRSTRLHCYETALLGQQHAGEMENALSAWAATQEEMEYVRGDIFCREEFVLFLIFNSEEDAHEQGLRAGIVYEASMADARKELDDFCRNVGEALSLLSNEATAYVLEKMEWESAPEELQRAEDFAAGREALTANERKELSPETARAAEVLEDAGARRLLRRLAEAHADGTVADLMSSLKGKTETEASLRRLAGNGLLRREMVISCRQVERPLFRLPSPDALSVIMASNAICSECGANIADEKVEELFVPTAVAASLLEDGSWLSKRLRSVLLQLGVPAQQITDAPAHSDGEAYMIVNICREPFLFVLKEGDLTSAHARHALAKQNETEATHLVVVATGKIQDEARTRLREHARRRSLSESLVEVLLIEGVEAVASELQTAFERVSGCAVVEELSALDASLGLSVGQMLNTRFRLLGRSGKSSYEIGSLKDESLSVHVK
jgi:hypothetical protein